MAGYENMVAPYRGILVWVDEPKEGTSQKGKPWKSVFFTIKYLDDKMSEQYMVFKLIGVKPADRLLSIPLGAEIRVIWRPGCSRFKREDGSLCWFSQNIAKIVTQKKSSKIVMPSDIVEDEEPLDDEIPY